MEYYSAIKRDVLVIYATTWMNLKIIILTERSQTETEYILYDSSYIKF